MDELVKRLRNEADCPDNFPEDSAIMREAADAIKTLEEYVSPIQSLPDCNTCMKKRVCEFAPRPGQMCRINCPHYLGDKAVSIMPLLEGFPDQVIAVAWAYADCLTKYGVDVSAEWKTVTAQRDALNRAYLQGRADEAERWSRREADKEGE